MSCRDLHIPSLVRGADYRSASTQIHPFNLAAQQMRTTMYRNRQPYQYQSSVSAVHKLQQFAANDIMLPANYPMRSVVSTSAFSDPWSREIKKKTIGEMQQRVVTPSAAVLDKRPPHWPGIGLPPPLKEHRQSLPHHSPNQNGPSHLSSFHDMGGKSPQNPMNLNNSAQKIGCPNQHYGANSDSACSRPPVSPSAVNSFDVEIHRLRGMITRVEMLREKYKYQEGALHYPSAMPCPHPSPIYRRALPASPIESKATTTWYADQQRRPTDRHPNNIHPFQQDALQNYHTNFGMNKMVHRQQIAPTGQFLKSTEHTQRAAFLDLNQYDGMPKIVDVRSLAVDVQGQHRNKKETQHSQTYGMKVSPNARSCMRSTTETRNETGSVDSHDSGVECTSSPIELQHKKNFVYGRSKQSELPTDDEVFVREEHHLSMFHYQVPNAPTSIARSTHSHRVPGLLTSPPLLIQNPRKRLSHAANETEVMAKKSKAVEGVDFIDRPGNTGSVSVSGEHNQALDLTLNKRNGHSEKHLTNGVGVKTEPDNEPINPALTRTCSGSEHCQDYCPSGMLHHHRELRSMEDPVDLSAKVANDISTQNPTEKEPMVQRPQQHFGIRNRFISSLRQRAAGILHQKSEKETQSNNLAQGSCSIDKDKDSKDANTVQNGVSKPSANLGKIQAATKSSQNRGQSPPNLDCNHKSQIVSQCIAQNKSSLICIDAMVNEAICVSRLPSTGHEELSLNSPLVETNNASSSVPEQSGACRSPGTLVINHLETNNCKGGTCGIIESQVCEVKADNMNSSCPANPEKNTSFFETQKAPQNATPSPSNICTQTAQTKLPEARVLVRQLKPFFPNPAGKISKSSTGSLTEAEKFKIKFTAISKGKHGEIAGSEIRAIYPTNSAPDFQIPTEDGFRRLQKVDERLHEIYRVTISPPKEHPLNRKTQPPHSVYYREMSFPCVLRSEVPFIPTHLLVQILFPGVEVATVCRALQQCNILNRYMTCDEQYALQDDLKERGITSCKLVPLDELHNNWNELLNNLSNN